MKAGRELPGVRAFVDAGLVYLLRHRSGTHEDRSVGGGELLVVRAFVDAGLVYLLLHRSGTHEDRSADGARCAA